MTHIARRHALDVLLVGAGLAGAWARAFVLDDAFISFRYAENLARGHGLVFNPSERVEGYTNFLWTVLLAPFAALEADLVQVARLLGLAFFLAALVCVRAFANEFRPADERWGWLPSLALLGCACNPTFLSFATGGLETPMFTFLVALGVWHLGRTWRAPGPRAGVVTGLIGVALALTRPDGALLLGVFGLSTIAAVRAQHGWKRPTLQLAAVVALTWVPYFVWRWAYYGWLFPNTYYAKNVADWQWERGVPYLGAFVASYPWVALVGAVALVASVPSLRRRVLPGFEDPARRGMAWTLVGALALFSLHVAKAGGDFMEFRFLAPLVPAFLLVLELAAWSAPRPAPWVGALCAALVLTFAVHEVVLLPPPLMEPVEQLADHIDLQRWDEQGRMLGRLLPPGTVIATTAAGAIPYYSKLEAIDLLGLTDVVVGHLPMRCTSEMTIGHCKYAPDAYLRLRRVNLVVYPVAAPVSFAHAPPVAPDEIVLRAFDDVAFRARYLVHTPALDALFAASPDVKRP